MKKRYYLASRRKENGQLEEQIFLAYPGDMLKHIMKEWSTILPLDRKPYRREVKEI